MKKILLFILISITINAQVLNKKIIDDKENKPMLIGMCNRSAFADTNFSAWFSDEYNRYRIDSTRIDSIKNIITDFKITVVMATWCGDSQREVPRFYKILDQLNYDEKGLTLICVDRTKKCPVENIENYSIKFVPTIIFFKNEIEKGRIVESPQETLEKDILKIVK